MVWQFRRILIIICILYINIINLSYANFSKEQLPLSKEEQSILIYHKGTSLLQQQKEVEAKALFQKALELFPKNHNARLQLVLLYQKIGWIDQVEKLLESGLELSPMNQSFIKYLAIIYNQKKHSKKALNLLLRIPDDQAQQQDYLALLAVTYLHNKQFDMAEKYYKQLLRIDEFNAVWWLGLAVAQNVEGHFVNALTSFNNAKKLGRFNYEVLEYINNILQNIKLKCIKNK